MKAFSKTCSVEARLFMRNFFSIFFTLVFPGMMLLLFGGIYGNEVDPAYGLGYMDYTMPSYAVMITGVTGLMSFPLTMTEYEDKKIYKRYDATPAGKETVLAAQMAVNVGMTFLGIALLYLIGKIFFDIRVLASAGELVVGLVLSTGCMFALGFFLTAVAKDAKIATALCYFVYFASLFLSGATMPSEILPESFKTVSNCLPMTYAVKLMQGINAGNALGEYGTEILVLTGTIVVCLLVGRWCSKRRSWA